MVVGRCGSGRANLVTVEVYDPEKNIILLNWPLARILMFRKTLYSSRLMLSDLIQLCRCRSQGSKWKA